MHAGAGDDIVEVRDGAADDIVFCGEGDFDTVYFDPGDAADADTCEIQNP